MPLQQETVATTPNGHRSFFRLLILVSVGLVLLWAAAYVYLQITLEPPAQSIFSTTECESAYGERIVNAARAYAQDGSSVEQALYYSTSLNICVGILAVYSGNISDYLIFDASTGDALGPADTATALEEYSQTFK